MEINQAESTHTLALSKKANVQQRCEDFVFSLVGLPFCQWISIYILQIKKSNPKYSE